MLTPNLKNANVRGNNFLSYFFLIRLYWLFGMQFCSLSHFFLCLFLLCECVSVQVLVCLFLTFHKSIINESTFLCLFCIRICVYMVFLFLNVHVYLFVTLCVYVCVCVSLRLCIPVYGFVWVCTMRIHMSVCLSNFMPLCLSLSPSLTPFLFLIHYHLSLYVGV